MKMNTELEKVKLEVKLEMKKQKVQVKKQEVKGSIEVKKNKAGAAKEKGQLEADVELERIAAQGQRGRGGSKKRRR